MREVDPAPCADTIRAMQYSFRKIKPGESVTMERHVTSPAAHEEVKAWHANVMNAVRVTRARYALPLEVSSSCDHCVWRITVTHAVRPIAGDDGEPVLTRIYGLGALNDSMKRMAAGERMRFSSTSRDEVVKKRAKHYGVSLRWVSDEDTGGHYEGGPLRETKPGA